MDRTDADPSLVTDYIIALLNHDNLKDSIKLKAFCLNQLQDFLESGIFIYSISPAVSLFSA